MSGGKRLAARLDGGETLLEITARGEIDREAVGLETKRLLPGTHGLAVGDHPWKVRGLDPPVERPEQSRIDPCARGMCVLHIRAVGEARHPLRDLWMIPAHPTPRGRIVEH